MWNWISCNNVVQVGQEGEIVAIDPDAQRIELAKEKNARLNIEYLVANDQSFPGYDYQLIISNHVIRWIKNKQCMYTFLTLKLNPSMHIILYIPLHAYMVVHNTYV